VSLCSIKDYSFCFNHDQCKKKIFFFSFFFFFFFYGLFGFWILSF
jgi:hypothetical protein